MNSHERKILIKDLVRKDMDHDHATLMESFEALLEMHYDGLGDEDLKHHHAFTFREEEYSDLEPYWGGSDREGM